MIDARQLAGPFSWRKVIAVVFSVGIRPCTGAILVLVFALTLFGMTDAATASSGSDSSGTHSYTSTCEAGLRHFTNTSDPYSTGDGVIDQTETITTAAPSRAAAQERTRRMAES